MVDLIVELIIKLGVPVAMLVVFIVMFWKKDKELSALYASSQARDEKRNEVIEKMASELQKALVENARAMEGMRVYLQSRAGN